MAYNPAMRPLSLLLAPLAAVLSTGCVTRTLTVTSEPAGARVFLNDREVGCTPLTVGFTFYGVYDVRLEHAGCAPLWTKASARQPWWEYPGVDLLAELTGPKRVDVQWHFKLAPQVPAALRSPEALMDHARQMRELNRQSTDAVDAARQAAPDSSKTRP